MDRETLLSYGIDGDRGQKNCMGNLAFYKKILAMFLEDVCFSRAKAAYEAGNGKELFSRMHELKGISGNAALTTLYEETSPLVELLRHGEGLDGDRKAEIDRRFAAVEAAYVRACEGAALYIAEG